MAVVAPVAAASAGLVLSSAYLFVVTAVAAASAGLVLSIVEFPALDVVAVQVVASDADFLV